MKIIVAVLILCFSVNSISAFGWFGFRSDEKPKQITNSPTTHHQVTHLQQSILAQKNQSVNATSSQRQADSINNKSNPIIYRNRFQGVVYQQQQHRALGNPTNSQRQADSINKQSSSIIQQNQVQDNPATFRQFNRVSNLGNNRMVQQKSDRFLPANRNNKAIVTPTKQRTLSQTSLSKSAMADSKPNTVSIIKNDTQPNQPQSILEKSILLRTTTGLREAFTTKPNDNYGNQNRRRILSNYYGQQQWRPFYLRPNSNLYSALNQRRRRRRNAQNNNQCMIFSRDAFSSQDIDQY